MMTPARVRQQRQKQLQNKQLADQQRQAATLRANAEPEEAAGPSGASIRQAESAASQSLQLCSICLENQKERLFFPCGHVCACGDCAALLQAQGSPCPMCRTPIERVINAFL